VLPFVAVGAKQQDLPQFPYHPEPLRTGSVVPRYGDWPSVSRLIVEEIAFRTPSFIGWQQEKWFTCCDDAAEFLDAAGAKELRANWPQALDDIRRECGLIGPEWEDYLASLNRDHGPTAYVFRCRHCGRYGGYSDCH
jgi:uncharacterized protein CbrC (UPF0167 family)